MQNDKKIAKQLLIWGGLLIILLVLLWGYKQNWWSGDYSHVSQEQKEQAAQDINTKMDEIAYWGYRIYLADVSGGEATGEAAYRFMNDQYELMVTANLPDPDNGYYYECWLERADPQGSMSIGKLFRSADGRYITTFITGTNYSGFPTVTISLESNDSNPAQAQVVLKGTFN